MVYSWPCKREYFLQCAEQGSTAHLAARVAPLGEHLGHHLGAGHVDAQPLGVALWARPYRVSGTPGAPSRVLKYVLKKVAQLRTPA